MGDDEIDMNKGPLLNEDVLPMALVTLFAALPTFGVSLLLAWGAYFVPRARAPKNSDGSGEFLRMLELATPLALVGMGWGIFAWKWVEGHPAANAVRSQPWPTAPVVIMVGILACGLAFGLAFVLRAKLARAAEY